MPFPLFRGRITLFPLTFEAKFKQLRAMDFVMDAGTRETNLFIKLKANIEPINI